jgi:invasion protein IalB
MLRLVSLLLALTASVPANADPTVREFGAWTMYCASPTDPCVIGLSLMSASSERFWIKARIWKVNDAFRMTFIVPPEARAERNIQLDGDVAVKGVLAEDCTQNACTAVWNLGQDDLAELLANHILVVRFGFDENYGVGFPLPINGLGEGIAQLK